uniref:Uncharacterized protein n=1 Tax=Anguilla anguilla TaxID=7936 RepID=A0A0E9QFV2_ANGAN
MLVILNVAVLVLNLKF